MKFKSPLGVTPAGFLFMSSTPLKGITVVDFSRLVPGPFCTRILQDWGATVISAEDQNRPDDLKKISPLLFHALNRSKKVLSFDLKSESGMKQFKQLIKKADVFLESSRPGVLTKRGLGFAQLKQLNKKLMYVSLTGFGQKGPNSSKAGHDINFMALAGVLNSQIMPSIQWADLAGGGLWAASSILAALQNSKRKALHLDISMTDTLQYFNWVHLMMAQTGKVFDTFSGVLARYRLYRTSDGRQMALGALEPKFWNRFCDLWGKPSWKDLNGSYPDTELPIHREVEMLFASASFAEWRRRAEGEDICLSPVLNSEEVLASSQLESGAFFKPVSFQGKKWLFPHVPLKVRA